MTTKSNNHKPDYMGVREFREHFQDLRAPVQVFRSRGGMQFVGTWTPAPHEAEPNRSTADIKAPAKMHAARPAEAPEPGREL